MKAITEFPSPPAYPVPTHRGGEEVGSVEGFVVVGARVFESAGSLIPALVFLAVVTGRILLGFLAEQRTKGRRMD